MMDRKKYVDAFQRILKIADRNHLDLPFRNDAGLRAKYFPGAGSHIGRKKLTDVYITEFTATHPNEKLLQHATFPWIHGYDASMAQLLDDLKKNQDNPVEELPANRRADIEKRFTKVGAEEIAAFWSIYRAADQSYRKKVITMLADITPPEIAPTGPPTLKMPTSSQPRSQTTGPDPTSQSAYALFGVLFFFVPLLILVGVQYWRQPDESHWIVLSLAALFGLITLIFLIDFLRKRNT